MENIEQALKTLNKKVYIDIAALHIIAKCNNWRKVTLKYYLLVLLPNIEFLVEIFKCKKIMKTSS